MTNGIQSERVMNVLRRGGVACELSGVWTVFRSHDLRHRSVGTMPENAVNEMLQRGSLRQISDHPPRLIWTGEDTPAGVPHIIPAIIPARTSYAAKGRRSLLEQIVHLHEAQSDKRWLVSAASRFVADTECAVTPQSMTMRWDAAPISGSRSRGMHSGPGEAASMALMRLQRVRQAISPTRYAILELVLIREVTRAGLARRFDIVPKAALLQADMALISLADAYDAVVPAVE